MIYSKGNFVHWPTNLFYLCIWVKITVLTYWEKCNVWTHGLTALLGVRRWGMKDHPQDPAYRCDSQNHIKATCQETVLDNRGIPTETKSSPDSGSQSLSRWEDTAPSQWVTGLGCRMYSPDDSFQHFIPTYQGPDIGPFASHSVQTSLSHCSGMVRFVYILFLIFSLLLAMWELNTQPHKNHTNTLSLPYTLSFFFFFLRQSCLDSLEFTT